MGAGIAEVCARAGLDVVVNEVDEVRAEAGRDRIRASLDRAVRSGKLTGGERAAVLQRVRVSPCFDELADRDVVFEAIAEDETLKTEVFARLDKVVENREAILASNTSSVPIMKLGVATTRPEYVLGVHFFNPVPVLPLVEIVPSLLTADAVRTAAEQLVTEVLGKEIVRSQDRAGFVVNALLIPYLLSAIRMVESGFASPEDIDRGMVLGCAHPMGPLRLADLIGLDTTKSIAESLYEEFKEALYSPPPLLSRMVDAGLLGRKSGRGFHTYS